MSLVDRRELTPRLNIRHAAIFGFLVGLRSMTPVASVISAAQARYGDIDQDLPAFLNTDLLVWGTRLMAVGELGLDKLPILPARTDLLPLLGRIGIASGVVAALERRAGRSSLLLPLVAGLGALVGSHVGYQVRKRLTDQLAIPDILLALAEDAAVTTGSALLAQNIVAR